MHTDEFEISILREVNNCASNLRRLNKIIKEMENKYMISTDEFIKNYSDNQHGWNPDFKKWFDTVESLKRWQFLYDEYMKFYKMMKI